MAGWADWDLWGLPAGSQGFTPNAKDDTLYLGEGATIAALATDLSQYADNQTTGATWHYEPAPASRFDVTTSWCIEVDFTANNTSGGRFWTQGGTGRWRVSIAAGVVTCTLQIAAALVTIGTLTLPGIGAGSERFALSWTASPNPYTTGASNAIRSEIRAFNKSDGSYAETVVTHAARDSETGAAVWWAGSTAGANAFTGTPHACRFGTGRPRTSTETHEDFVATTAEPTLELAARCEFPIVDPVCDLGDAGQLVGPVHFQGAQAVKQNAFRSFSPIVNAHYLNRTAITLSSLTEIPTQWRREATDGIYTMAGPWMFYRPVPPTATHLRARVFVKHWNTGTVGVRLYSMNRPPVSADVVDQNAAHTQTFASASVSTDHGSGGTDGEWLELEPFAVTANSDDHTWLVLGLTAVGNPGTGVFEIGAIVVEPGVVE